MKAKCLELWHFLQSIQPDREAWPLTHGLWIYLEVFEPFQEWRLPTDVATLDLEEREPRGAAIEKIVWDENWYGLVLFAR